MKTKTTWLAMLAILATLSTAQTLRAITFGEPDKGRHPNVGAVMIESPLMPPELPRPYQLMSGTLIGPRLFLTAGHGTSTMEYVTTAEGAILTLDDFYVTFNDNPADTAGRFKVVAIYTHPGYKPAEFTLEGDINWLDAHGLGSIPIEDMGLLVLEEAPNLTPAKLPDVGFLDELKRTKQLTPETKLLAVGYGSRATVSPPAPVGINEAHNRELAFSEYRGLNHRWLIMSMNLMLDNGGTGYGDSGGPRFWVDPADGSEHLVAITSRGDPNLVTLDAAYRIDTPAALDFIKAVAAEIEETASK